MPTVTDLGKQAAHPDVMTSLVERINETLTEILPSGDAADVRDSDMHILQQRTLYGLSWSNLWGASWSLHDEVADVDVSVGLVACTPTGGRKQLVLYQAQRLPDQEWAIARMGSAWLEDPPKKPWTSISTISRGLGVAWGVVAHSPDLGKGRIALVDGQIAESVVSNGSFLMFVPFHLTQLWSSTVKIGFYATDGREILTESYPLPSGS